MHTVLLFLLSLFSFVPFVPKYVVASKNIAHITRKTVKNSSHNTNTHPSPIVKLNLTDTPMPQITYTITPTQGVTYQTATSANSQTPSVIPSLSANQATSTDNTITPTQTPIPTNSSALQPTTILTPTPTQNPCYLEQVTYTDSNGNCHPGINPAEATARSAIPTPTPTDTPYQYCVVEAKAKLPPYETLPANVCSDLLTPTP